MPAEIVAELATRWLVAELATRWLDGGADAREKVMDAIEAEHSSSEIAYAALAVGTAIGIDGAEQLGRAFEDRAYRNEGVRDTMPSDPTIDPDTVLQ